MNFDVSRLELDLIDRIIKRAEDDDFAPVDRCAKLMDLSACIANGCSLKLDEMLNADNSNFYHDFHGITNHINRTTGKLEGGFLPRFAFC